MSTHPKELVCKFCNGELTDSDIFCGQCGKAVTNHTESRQDVFVALQPVLLYYFITLLLLSTYKLTSVFPEGLDGMVIVSAIDILIVLAFWYHNYDELISVWSLRNIKLKLIGITILAAILGAIVVSCIALLISRSIYDAVFYETSLYEGTQYPFLIATLMVGIQPAIFEEVAFRGFLFNYLRKVTSSTGVVYITSFLFGIIHMQFISLLWLIPMGLIFAYARNRYNTLWYGVVGHFAYNFMITVIDYFDLISKTDF